MNVFRLRSLSWSKRSRVTRAAAKQAALTGDDAELDRAEAALRAAQDRNTTLKAALTEVDQQLEALERTKAEIADRKVRAETAAEIELLVRELTQVGAEFNSTAARLSDHTARAVPVVFDALGLDKFMAICRAEVPAALELVSKLLRAHADAVVAGTAPAKLPRPAEASVPAPAQPPKEPHFKYSPVKQSLKGLMAR
ncbi:hypothetical protein ACVJDU_008349 [Bradyrhizobium diazoefficiens]